MAPSVWHAEPVWGGGPTAVSRSSPPGARHRREEKTGARNTEIIVPVATGDSPSRADFAPNALTFWSVNRLFYSLTLGRSVLKLVDF